VAEGIKALIWPAVCPPAGGAHSAGSGDIKRHSIPAITLLNEVKPVPFPFF
jgi:hypothetical protein